MTDSTSADAVPEGLTVSLIAAVAQNRVIGVDDEMPWHYPADLRHFKETTTGHPVIMGRRTYESIVARLGGPLPGRTNIVLSSRDRDYDEDIQVVDSVAAALSAAAHTLSGPAETPDDSGTAYVIGGASVYEQLLPLADRLVITEIPATPEGDTVFPAWDPEQWDVVDREQDGELTFVTYERRE
jgi:dihydrofolate reductase